MTKSIELKKLSRKLRNQRYYAKKTAKKKISENYLEFMDSFPTIKSQKNLTDLYAKHGITELVTAKKTFTLFCPAMSREVGTNIPLHPRGDETGLREQNRVVNRRKTAIKKASYYDCLNPVLDADEDLSWLLH